MTDRGHSRKKQNKSSRRGYYCVLLAVFIFAALTGFFILKCRHYSLQPQEASEPEKGRPIGGETLAESISADTPGSTEPQGDSDQIIREQISQMTLEQKTAQLFIITPEALTGYDAVTQAGEATYEALKEYPVGGLIYFSQNLQNPEQLKEMTRKTQEYAARLHMPPLFLSVDEEGGTIARIANHAGFQVPHVDTMAEIGDTKDPSNAYEAGALIGTYLAEYGINLDFAPDADVLTNPSNTVVKDRSFGSDPQLAADMAQAYIKGLEAHHVYGTPKHFPGHGATEGDSHKGFAYTYKNWEELEKSELVPFARLIQDHTPFIMAGHISLPNITGDDTPSSLSPQVLTGYLRGSMGYDGIIITDALNMGAIENNYPSGQAAVMTLKAGADLLLMPGDFKEAYDAVIHAVHTGELTEERIDQSLMRILKVKG